MLLENNGFSIDVGLMLLNNVFASFEAEEAAAALPASSDTDATDDNHNEDVEELDAAPSEAGTDDV